MLFPVFTCIVEADHHEDNELLVFLSSSQNLLHNFLKVWMPFEKKNQKSPRLPPLGIWMNSKVNRPAAQRTHGQGGTTGNLERWECL